MPSDKTISAVPTTIITGFLGVGKTSAILHLLNHKPNDERWAILVNEFGEIGVDGNLFEGQYTQEQNVFIKEVPGGCMCCTAGLPMQVALNELLKQSTPDRLFIEPTGLGHPKEVLQSLSSDAYRDVLSLQKVLTLVDARKLSDARYTEHTTFNQQIALADIVVGNKQDLYQEADNAALTSYVAQHGAPAAQVFFTQHGDISDIDLSGPTAAIAPTGHHHHHKMDAKPLLTDTPIPECGYIKALNKGEGFYSVGWRFSGNRRFDKEKVSAFLQGVNAERIKAVLITAEGIFAYNLTSNTVIENELTGCEESRVEIIADGIHEDWETQLMHCLVTDR